MTRKAHTSEKRGKKHKVEVLEAGVHTSIKLSLLKEGDKVFATLTNKDGVERVIIFKVLQAVGVHESYPLVTMQWADAAEVSNPVSLEGTGAWTTRRENPVQTQERALSIAYGHVGVGGIISFIVDIPTEARQRYTLDAEGEKVTKLEVVRK